jgi:hypothetical protein
MLPLPQMVNLPSRGSNEVTCHSTVVTPASCSPNMLAPLNMILIVGVALYIVLCFWLQREGSLNLGNALKALMVIPASLVLWTIVSDLWAFVLDIAEPFVEAYRRRKPTGNSDLTRCSLDKVVNLFV